MLLLYIILLGTATYYFLKRKHTYWKRRGFAQLEPEFLFGNIRKVIFGDKSIDEVVQNAYDEFRRQNLKHGGIYQTYIPVWIPVDTALIKQIMIKDYDYFDSHGFFSHEKDPISVHLFNLHGSRWRELRAKLTPTFTSVKLKMMFEMVNVLGERLENLVDELCKSGEPLELKETSARFGTDVIATTFFGVECNSLREPDNEFRRYGKHVFEPRPLKMFLEQIINWDLLVHLGYSFIPKNVYQFFFQLARSTIAHRRKNKISRKDYLDLLIQLMEGGEMRDDDGILGDSKTNGILTFDEVLSNMFIMYLAGFETSSTTSSFLMYELAKHQEIQNKARQEILGVLGNRSAKDLIYEDLAEMKYCEMCIKETLRLYPPLAQVPRRCTRDYKIPGTNKLIQKGVFVMIPVRSIQTDPQNYPDPWTFNPENFNLENYSTRPDYFSFLAFGGGPKLCIGSRFAYMQIKITMVKLLTNYKYFLNPNTPQKPNFLANTITLTSKEDLLLDIVRVK